MVPVIRKKKISYCCTGKLINPCAVNDRQKFKSNVHSLICNVFLSVGYHLHAFLIDPARQMRRSEGLQKFLSVLPSLSKAEPERFNGSCFLSGSFRVKSIRTPTKMPGIPDKMKVHLQP